MISVLVGVVAPPSAKAGDTCGTRCWETYGVCYKSTSNRERCQGQLLRCLNNCIRAKRRPAAAAPETPRATPQRTPDPGRGKSAPPPADPMAPLFPSQ
jgi:hypothetical protein